ncbi:hypothetical protein NTGBS_510047 [Candidatus Nitrotoga sp. BS]|nr:hypothetical protein NTGBS_510047 [Candidatus Nitrotoga sp. BS]
MAVLDLSALASYHSRYKEIGMIIMLGHSLPTLRIPHRRLRTDIRMGIC